RFRIQVSFTGISPEKWHKVQPEFFYVSRPLWTQIQRSISKTLAGLILMACISVFAQSPPASPDRPWHSVEERQLVNDGRRFRQPPFPIESDRAYSLAELIDLAEAHNPQTRVAWENARAQAAALGIARSELYP